MTVESGAPEKVDKCLRSPEDKGWAKGVPRAGIKKQMGHNLREKTELGSGKSKLGLESGHCGSEFD